MSSTLKLRKSSTLSRNTIQNINNDGQCLIITTRSCKSTIDTMFPTMEELKNDSTVVDKTSVVESRKVTCANVISGEDNGKGKVYEHILK